MTRSLPGPTAVGRPGTWSCAQRRISVCAVSAVARLIVVARSASERRNRKGICNCPLTLLYQPNWACPGNTVGHKVALFLPSYWWDFLVTVCDHLVSLEVWKWCILSQALLLMLMLGTSLVHCQLYLAWISTILAQGSSPGNGKS